jgi:hydroxybutyrate-dimer hydrolase
MDLMYVHLRTGQGLPPSQVVHTIPRGPGAPPITAANVPPISNAPASANLITMSGGRLKIPN